LKRKCELLVEIIVWNAARVKETARREQLYWMLETDADVLRELFKVLSMEQLLHVAVLMKVRAVINVMRDRQEKRIHDDFIDKTIIIY
jgi:hypothetical protein